ncbi:glycosyltransferase [Modestobacter sp. VKM Ac-2977]|uniref:glycosyltransferase family 2 protein n=1 Tax=Modestobacter sp. VKM Ac-2977 TaxID=3004131 RepID=UPI0022AA30BE|nr:glycosyltransferase [Modestobacter sp. VKM Ac-2977]MCZ2819101.1 glycosyltransferase [Modestobacter sp. VKM Ac-2977]
MTASDTTPAPTRADGGRSLPDSRVEVLIGVLTFRRPDDLAALLPVLLEQAAEVDRPERRVGVLVVDNDPQGSARGVVDELGSALVRYVVEPTPGIAAARNRVLDEAEGCTFVVFIDDDERPRPGWLAHLLRTQEETGAAAVAGAVVSAFEGPLDPWVRDGAFFSRRRLATGTVIDVAATNNLLLDVAAVRAAGLRFDAAFGLSGGSDTLFTRLLAASGARLVWCDEAVVTDSVPSSRMTREWVLRRAFRSGNSASRVDLVLAGSAPARSRARLRGARRGAPRLVAGLARWLLGCVVGSAPHRARGLRTACRGAGMLTGSFGVVYHEYRRAGAVTVAGS